MILQNYTKSAKKARDRINKLEALEAELNTQKQDKTH